MTKPLLIIVSGPPASGKTTLAQRLSRELHLPAIHKDDVKESLFDSLGWSDREWSQRLGRATLPLLFYFVEAQLAAGCSHIVECNFIAEYHTPKFLELKQKYDYEPFQIQCRAEGEVLFQRYLARGETGQRHPGHVDPNTYEELRPRLLKGFDEPLNIGGIFYEVDTTDFEAVDYEKLVAAIQEVKFKLEKSQDANY